MATETLSPADFVRQFTMRSTQIAWLLGAGASAAAGVPTAGHMIAGFKADLFASAHKIARREIDADDPVWASRISIYFDGANGFPPSGNPSEYQVAFERIYPEARDRRTYMDQQISKGSPSFGHRVMAALIASRKLPLLFTTNFDDLIEQATRAMDELLDASERARLAVSALNSTDIAERCLRESDWPLLVKIHGDYQSVALKNTEEELQTQDRTLRRVLSESTRRFGLAVVGYSGRDASIMEVLVEALQGEDPFPGSLYWITRPSTPLLPMVTDLLEQARAKGVDVWVVESETFDELFAEVDRQMTLPPVLAKAVSLARPATAVVDVALPTTDVSRFPALRCNALVIERWPLKARAIRNDAVLTSEELRETLRRARAHADAVSTGSDVLAFGSDDDLRQALGMSSAQWAPRELTIDIEEDSVAFGLVYKALARALSYGRPLRHDFRNAGHSLHLDDPARATDVDRRRRLEHQLATMREVYENDLFGTVPGHDRAYAEGVALRLEHRLDRWWLLFEPFTWVQRPKERLRPDPIAPWLQKRWTLRRNKEWAAMVDTWAQLLAPNDHTEVRAWGLGESTAGINATFILGKLTAWSQPGQAGIQ